MSRRDFLAVGAAAAAAAIGGGQRRARSEEAPAPGGAPASGSPLDRVAIDQSTIVGQAGFYRVGRSKQERWWFIRPDGRPFLHKGLCAMGPLQPPKEAAGAAADNKQDQAGPDPTKYTLGLLAELGFNAFGAWVSSALWNQGWPYAVLIHVRKATGNKWTVMPPKHIDIFDPAWRAAYDAVCKQTCTPLAQKKDLLGYFVDNEATWAQARADHVFGQQGPMVDRNILGKEPLLLQYFLALDPGRGGHRAAWDFVLARHGGSAAQVARDWGAAFDSPAKLIEMHGQGLVLDSKAFAADQDAFTAHFTREYFRITAETIRRYDPNHLLLGCRHGGPPGEAVLTAYDRRHVDVLSMNNYRPNFRGRIEEYYRHAKMPILNGEYSWAAFGMAWDRFTAGDQFSEKQMAEQRRLGIAGLEGAFTHPGLVGYTFYKGSDAGRRGPEQPSWGVVNAQGQLNNWNASLLRQSHPRLEGIACGEIAPAKA
jgi:hypothetical protein